MAKKGKSKKQGGPPNLSQAKKNGIFAPKRDSEKGQSQHQKASARAATRMTGQNSRKGG